MPISERIQNIKFSKSVAGYNAKEVEGFLGDLLPLVQEQEQLLSALRTKLDAMEKRTDEIAKQEKEAYRLLESARAEAESIIAAAEKKSDTIRREAEQTAEVKLRIAETSAAEKETIASRNARDRVETAKKNAETILAAADRKGKAILAEAIAAANEEKQKAKVLSAECTVFESHFRTLVADTVRALAKLQENAPRIPEIVPAAEMPKPVAPPAPQAEPEAVAAPVPAAEENTEPRDFAFAGGKPMYDGVKATAEVPRRKLYDTVTVTYDNDDGFDDIRKLMEESSAKQMKSPTHFSE